MEKEGKCVSNEMVYEINYYVTHLQRTATVALTRIMTTSFMSSAQEYVGYEFMSTGT